MVLYDSEQKMRMNFELKNHRIETCSFPDRPETYPYRPEGRLRVVWNRVQWGVLWAGGHQEAERRGTHHSAVARLQK